MPAPAVKFVVGSIRMNAPVPRLFAVLVEDQRARRLDRDPADVVEQQPRIHLRRRRARRVLQDVQPVRLERPLVHPHDVGLKAPAHVDVAVHENVAAADVEFVFEHDASPTSARTRRRDRRPSVTSRLTRLDRTDGQAVIVSPTRIVPDRICPPYPRKSWSGRMTICTGSRSGPSGLAFIDLDRLEVLEQAGPRTTACARSAR